MPVSKLVSTGTASTRDAIIRLLHDVAGRGPIATLGQGKPNHIVRLDRENAWVETEKSRKEQTGPQPVPLDWITDSYETLLEQGSLKRTDLGQKASKRSAFIFAVLAQMHGVEASANPIELRLSDPLS